MEHLILNISNIDDAVTKKYTQNTDLYLNTQVSITIYVDKNRTDTYTEDGSITKPYKTIQAAIDRVAVLENGATTPRCGIKISAGNYAENLLFEDARLSKVHLIGTARDTRINPSSGNAIQSIANNDGLSLILDGVLVQKPILMEGASNGTNCIFICMNTEISSTVTLTNMQQAYFHIGTSVSGVISLTNVRDFKRIDNNVISLFSSNQIAISLDRLAAKVPSGGLDYVVYYFEGINPLIFNSITLTNYTSQGLF